MPERLRFLLDTNILIPLQDSQVVLEPNLANFVRLANVGGHALLYHSASREDIQRDKNTDRRDRTLARLSQYTVLQDGPPCPWNTTKTSVNDACDNGILYALERGAAHALVTQDQKLHSKAKARGLGQKVHFIQSAEDWLKRLHGGDPIVLPNISDLELQTLTPLLGDPFFDSLREGYAAFDKWFHEKAQDGRKAWVYQEPGQIVPAAMCIYTVQRNELVNDAKEVLPGDSLKLCTFKVGELVRGRKIGELFLKAAFRYATSHRCEHIFLTANAEDHRPLIDLLEDFGFSEKGMYGNDAVYVKHHPITAPASLMPGLDYVRAFYPHYRRDLEITKFIIPIQPQFHRVLFPDWRRPGRALHRGDPRTHVGNAMKLAYVCHSPTKSVQPGDIVIFYRSGDLKAATTLAIVEQYVTLDSAEAIAQLVRRRTVYSMAQIEQMAAENCRVMLFRLIEHFTQPVGRIALRRAGIPGSIVSIRHITDDTFSNILTSANR